VKKLRITQEILHASSLGQVGKLLSGTIKDLSLMRAKLESCFVMSELTGKPVVDPFRAGAIFPDFWKECGSTLPIATNVRETLDAWIAVECGKTESLFEAALAACCKSNKWHLEGRFPTFVIDGFLSVRANPADALFQVGNSKVKSLFFDSVAPLIKEAILEERRRKFDDARFLENLYRAYERAVTLRRIGLGEPAPIREVFQELVFVLQSAGFRGSGKKAQFVEYTLEFFSRDLAKLIALAPCKTQTGNLLNLEPTSFAVEGVPIRQEGSVRIFGYISFTEGGAK
jgi:hypothetical protein